MKKWIFLSGLMAGMLPCSAQNAPQPYGALPTQAQLDWHEMEMYCIIHYSVDTYTDREWGYGDEDPALINPARFDAHQIVAAAKAGGFKGVVVVAKHHDGLCLWPTETTAHSIRKSPWKNGKGDMIQEYREACDQLDMKLGLYCSPWDRNSAYYGKPEYVDLYRRQLKELYTNYGKLFISWHDGANGGDGYYGGSRETRKIDRSSYYGWETTWALIRGIQPGAAIFGDVGPDVRWVGNEEGHAGETCWATYEPQAPEKGRLPSNGFTKYQLGTEGTRNGKYWMPAECDVSLRPGWFYHARENSRVKTPDELLDLYYKSVGRGANLDLGLSPNPDGQLDPEDVASLQQFGYILHQTFSKNLAAGASLSASNTRGNNLSLYGPENLLDDDRYSYWATDDQVTNPELTLTLPTETTFNIIRLRENIRLGQRIEAFTIEAFTRGKWEKIAAATSIGPNRLIRLQHSVTASGIRLTITQSPVAVALSDFGLYHEPELLRKPVITRSPEGKISITSSPKGSKIYYTLDGSPPTPSSSPYRKPFRLPEGGLVKALAVDERQQSQMASLQAGPVKTAWKMVQPKYPGKKNPAEYAIDDRPETFCQASSMPSEMVIDMGRKQNIKAFTYLPRQDGDNSGTVTHYRIETSEDSVQWQETADGEFSNIKANPVEQVVIFQKPASARFIRFKATEILSGSGMTAAEIGVLLK